MQIIKDGHLVESETGEVITQVEQVRDLVLENRNDPIMDLIEASGSVPIHARKAKELGVPAHIVSTYVGTQSVSANEYLNKKIHITGAIVYFSGRFTPKVTDPNAPGYKTGEGFYAFLLKTDMFREFKYESNDQLVKTKIPVVIKCDGVKVRETIIGLMEQYGWFDWHEVEYDDNFNPKMGKPIKVPVVFTRGGENNTFFITVLPE